MKHSTFIETVNFKFVDNACIYYNFKWSFNLNPNFCNYKYCSITFILHGKSVLEG